MRFAHTEAVLTRASQDPSVVPRHVPGLQRLPKFVYHPHGCASPEQLETGARFDLRQIDDYGAAREPCSRCAIPRCEKVNCCCSQSSQRNARVVLIRKSRRRASRSAPESGVRSFVSLSSHDSSSTGKVHRVAFSSERSRATGGATVCRLQCAAARVNAQCTVMRVHRPQCVATGLYDAYSNAQRKSDLASSRTEPR